MDENWKRIVCKKIQRLSELADWASNAGYERVRTCCKLAENYLMTQLQKEFDIDLDEINACQS